MLQILNRLNKQTKILSIITICCIIATTFLCANTVKFYTQKKLTVNATVVRMDMYNDSTADNSDWGYDVYVNYSCIGKMYKNIHYGRVSIDTDLKEGTKFDIQVYAKEPDKVASNSFAGAWVFLGFSVALIVISVKNIKDDLKEEKGD